MPNRIPALQTPSYYTARHIPIWLRFTRNRAEPFYAQLYDRLDGDESITVVLHGVYRFGRSRIVRAVFRGDNHRRDAQEYLVRNGFTPFEE
jgi:hypothetical protein